MLDGRLCLYVIVAFGVSLTAQAREPSPDRPGCTDVSPRQCLDRALDAMGGRERLQQVHSVRLQTSGHTLLMEQSYRQAPFIVSYQTTVTTVDLVNQRIARNSKLTWPESDANQAESESTLVVGAEGGVIRGQTADSPCSLNDLDAARQAIFLGPLRLLQTASEAADLRFAAPESLRSTPHTVLSFTWHGMPVRVVLNAFNHLPDALETTRTFHDFWYFWGDVRQRVYFDNWKLVHGVSYPTNLIEERNGTIWNSTQALNVEFNVPIDEKSFVMDGAATRKSLAGLGWNRPFSNHDHTELAPGVDLYAGSWNSTVIRQSDGILILEAPISTRYTQGVMDEAKSRYPGMRIKAVLSTSDSWPHVGGVRSAVAAGLPVYILDLNQPLLDRLVHAPHSLEPDITAGAAGLAHATWKLVSQPQEIGVGENRLLLIPLRGASTERQYMVYFPQHRLLYASDTLALNDDGSLYDPELMHEVVQAVEHTKLQVDTVFAMHQGPMPWKQVIALIERS
jgi:hypothetical protein